MQISRMDPLHAVIYIPGASSSLVFPETAVSQRDERIALCRTSATLSCISSPTLCLIEARIKEPRTGRDMKLRSVISIGNELRNSRNSSPEMLSNLTTLCPRVSNLMDKKCHTFYPNNSNVDKNAQRVLIFLPLLDIKSNENILSLTYRIFRHINNKFTFRSWILISLSILCAVATS